MSDSQKTIRDVLRRSGVLLPNDYTPNWSYDRKLDELAAEIDKALGGLKRETWLLNEYATANGSPPKRKSRLVSDWTEVDQ